MRRDIAPRSGAIAASGADETLASRNPTEVAQPTLRDGICLLAALLLLAVVTPAFGQVGGDYDLRWSTIDGGGATSLAGGGYDLGGTAGQPDAGSQSGGSYALSGGFWSGVAPAATATPTLTPTTTRTSTGTSSPTATATRTPTSPIATPTHTPTATPSLTPTSTRTSTGVATNTRTPTGIPSLTPTPTRSPTATATTTGTVPATPTATATTVPSPTPTSLPGILAGDANCDGAVTAADLPALALALDAGDPQACGADVDCSGTVDDGDVSALIAKLFSAMLPTPCENQAQP